MLWTLHAVLKNYYEPFEQNHEIKVGRFVADIVGEQGVIEIQTRNFGNLLEKLDNFLEFCSWKSGVVPGAYELLNYLKGKGYRMHICSNGFHEVQYKKLHSSNLYDYFDTIILSEDAGANKPSPTFFDYAFEISGAKPETTLMIGDNFITDIQGAKKAGIDVMFYNAHPDDFTSPEPVNFEVHNLLEIKNIL